jgi:hypothetical protein
MTLDLRTRTKTQLQTEALILAGDSEGTDTSLWTSTETSYAADAAYAELMSTLIHKRHPSTRFITYHDSAVTNPVTTFVWGTTQVGTDIEAVHISDEGDDLSTGGTHTVIDPTDWEFLSEILWGANSASISDPKYYVLTAVAGTVSEGLNMWVGALPATAGSNSIMVISYGYQDWADADAAPFPMKFDQVYVNLCAVYLRLQKDLSILDLKRQSELLLMRLLQVPSEPIPPQDYQIPCAGRMSRINYYPSRTGWIRRTNRRYN